MIFRIYFVKNYRIFVPFTFAAVLLTLGGCTTVNTPQKNLAHFEAGEQSIYAVVLAPAKPLSKQDNYSKICGKDESVTLSHNKWMELNVCAHLDKWQRVFVVYHHTETEKMKIATAYAPHDPKVEKGDIVEVSIELSVGGELTRTPLVKRIARKGKDATKASGCWWDSGSSRVGGAVCDGWNWRDQKWAK